MHFVTCAVISFRGGFYLNEETAWAKAVFSPNNETVTPTDLEEKVCDDASKSAKSRNQNIENLHKNFVLWHVQVFALEVVFILIRKPPEQKQFFLWTMRPRLVEIRKVPKKIAPKIWRYGKLLWAPKCLK